MAAHRQISNVAAVWDRMPGPVPLTAQRRGLPVDCMCERDCDDQRSMHIRANSQMLRERHVRGLTWRLCTLTPNEPTDQATEHQSYE